MISWKTNSPNFLSFLLPPTHTHTHTHTMQEVVLCSVAQNLELVEDRYGEWCREKQKWNDKVHTLHGL